MQSHSTLGYEMLRRSERQLLKAAAIITNQHHERWDGTGYPSGLREEEIHIYGRIVAICDVFDALTSTSLYRDAISFEDALSYLREQKGKQFDPYLTDLFLNHSDQVKQIFNQLHENDLL
jgi:HD-GYP domain-containing protein (c-di-GMP phosphodiesterase class II)